MKLDQDKDNGVKTLRSKFCDSLENTLVSPAQQAIDEECKHPRQSPVQQHEPFEPFGIN